MHADAAPPDYQRHARPNAVAIKCYSLQWRMIRCRDSAHPAARRGQADGQRCSSSTPSRSTSLVFLVTSTTPRVSAVAAIIHTARPGRYATKGRPTSAYLDPFPASTRSPRTSLGAEYRPRPIPQRHRPHDGLALWNCFSHTRQTNSTPQTGSRTCPQTVCSE